MLNEWLDASPGAAPAAAALATVLRTVTTVDIGCRQEGLFTKPVQVFSYRKDFSFLWKSLDALVSPRDNSLDLVIVWDGVPVGDVSGTGATANPSPTINLADHVTVFDWIVALCCKASQHLGNTMAQESPGGQDVQAANQASAAGQSGDSTTDLPDLRLFILDLAPPKHSTSFGVRTFLDFLPRLPWVRVYRPVATFEEQIETLAGVCVGEKELNALLRPVLGPQSLGITQLLAEVGGVGKTDVPESPSLHEYARSLPEIADRLCGLWTNELTKAGDRHSVSNIIGVRTLLAAMKVETSCEEDAREHIVFEALERLMGALGLLPQFEDPDENQGEDCAGTWFDREKWHRDVDSVVLVDDMHNLGWSEFLKSALGCEDGTLKSCDRPDETGFGPNGDQNLVSLLVDAEGRLCVSAEKSGGLTLCGTNKKEILFLDLRLFANRNSAEELRFFEKLLNLAEQATEDREELAWEGFSPKDLAAIRRCIENKDESRDNDDYFVALTLLPRLISLVAPWLPIVLFSSTGQRQVVDRLKAYGNVITGFEKPRFFGHSSTDVVAETKAKFERAMEKSVELARGRQVCLEILEKDRKLSSSRRLFKHTGSDSRTGNAYVELYLDESGDPTKSRLFSVGGLAIVYPDKVAAAEFSLTLAQRGFVWGRHMDDPFGEKPYPFLYKRPERTDLPRHPNGERPTDKTFIQRKLQAIGDLAKNNQIEIAEIKMTVQPSSAPFASWRGPDFLYRLLVRDVVDLFLFEWAPRNVDLSTARFAVYVATRSLVEDVITCSKRFGLGFREISDAPNRVTAMVVEDDDYIKSHLATEDGVSVKKVKGQLKAYVDIANLTDEQQDELRQKQGRDANKLLAFSFDSDDVHPILAGIYDSRSVLDTGSQEDTVEGRGVQLCYFESYRPNFQPNLLPRQMHYAADWAVSFSDAIPTRWKKAGFHEDRNEHLLHLVQACHFASETERRVDAIVEWANARNGESSELRGWATERVAQCVGALAGLEFVDLCRVLNRSLDSSRAPLGTETPSRSGLSVNSNAQDDVRNRSVSPGRAETVCRMESVAVVSTSRVYILDGCPLPPRVDRQVVNVDVKKAGFQSTPKRKPNCFVIEVDPVVDRAALETALANGITICGHTVTLLPFEGDE